MRKTFLASIVIIGSLLVACASTPETQISGVTLISDEQYQEAIDKNSAGKELYSGLYNTLNIRATLLRPSMNAAVLQKNARMYQWDKPKFDEESAKSATKTSQETEVFVSFFTPEKKHDDLHKNKTLWKIFLDVNGKRYEGKAAKIKLLTTEIQAFYPEHNSFSTPYLISFPVAANTLEKSDAKLTLTGPITSVSLDFNINK